MELKNKKIAIDDFMAERKDVLKTWVTGKKTRKTLKMASKISGDYL